MPDASIVNAETSPGRSIIAGAKNKDAAHAFVDWVGSKDAHEILRNPIKTRWIHFENLVTAVFWSAEENIMPTVPQNARQNIVDAVSSFTDTRTQKCVWYTSIE